MRSRSFWIGLVLGWALVGWLLPIRDLAAKMRRS